MRCEDDLTDPFDIGQTPHSKDRGLPYDDRVGRSVIVQRQAQIAWPRRLIRAARYRIAGAHAAKHIRDVTTAIKTGGALDGKIALVTGASRGIGLAITRAFARAGARCIILAIDADQGIAAQTTLAAEGLRVELVVADLRETDQVRAAAASVAEMHSHIDILVNNAGVFFAEDRTGYATEIDEAMVQHTIAVNVMGVLRVTNAFLPLIRAGGRIINVSSVMGLESHKADGRGMAYRMSKASLNSYTRSLAAELEPRGIMVDAFHPGWVKTIIGGPDAKIDAEDSVDTAFFLAMRPRSHASGLFWNECRAWQ